MMSITGLTGSSTACRMNELDDMIAGVVCAPVLLVASDYDGTLAPIVNDPAQAKPHRAAVVALRQLASLPQTHVSVISGRALSELARLLGDPEHVHLVGSHGSEFDLDFATSLSPDERNLRERLQSQLNEIAANHEGAVIEPKPGGVAFHYRNSSEPVAQRALQAGATTAHPFYWAGFVLVGGAERATQGGMRP